MGGVNVKLVDCHRMENETPITKTSSIEALFQSKSYTSLNPQLLYFTRTCFQAFLAPQEIVFGQEAPTSTSLSSAEQILGLQKREHVQCKLERQANVQSFLQKKVQEDIFNIWSKFQVDSFSGSIFFYSTEIQNLPCLIPSKS